MVTALELAEKMKEGKIVDKDIGEAATKAIKIFLEVSEGSRKYYDLLIRMKEEGLTEFEIGMFFTHFKCLLQPEELTVFAEMVRLARMQKQTAKAGGS